MKSFISAAFISSLMLITSCAHHGHGNCGEQCDMKKEGKTCTGQCHMEKTEAKAETKTEEVKK